jgi:hypothetical protein
MRKAQEKLDEAKRRDARQEQEKAIEELETARAELEEILRQMREEEVERLLVQLETRLRTMLRAQRAVLAGAEKLAAEQSQADRERQLEAVRLSREQNLIGLDATKALTLVRDDGSAVAIPEALEQVRDDSNQAASRLARSDVGGTTRGILQDLVTSLEEMLAALEKAQQEQQERQQGNQGGRPAEPGEQPLVDKLAELKMIRTLQMRVNSRTKRFSKLLADGTEQADEPELLDALERLAERQRKIERAAHDIVTGPHRVRAGRGHEKAFDRPIWRAAPARFFTRQHRADMMVVYDFVRSHRRHADPPQRPESHGAETDSACPPDCDPRGWDRSHGLGRDGRSDARPACDDRPRPRSGTAAVVVDSLLCRRADAGDQTA